MKVEYPARFVKGKDGFYAVQFRDFPEAMTQGNSLEQAIANASECISLVLEYRFDNKEEIPKPSKGKSKDKLIAPEPRLQVALLVKWSAKEMTTALLARKLHTSWAAANMLQSPKKVPTITTLEKVAKIMGKKLIIELR